MPSTSRYCIVLPDDGLVTVRLSVPPYIAAGSDFILYNEDGTRVVEQWKLSAENNSYADRIIKTDIRNLNRKNLAWAVLSCSLNPRISEALIEIEFFQKESLCQMTLPASQRLLNIPPCKVKGADKFSGSLMFIVRS